MMVHLCDLFYKSDHSNAKTLAYQGEPYLDSMYILLNSPISKRTESETCKNYSTMNCRKKGRELFTKFA